MKLERYGITGPVNTWVEKFLKDRKQRVKVCIRAGLQLSVESYKVQ